jgi:hypothetical protein
MPVRLERSLHTAWSELVRLRRKPRRDRLFTINLHGFAVVYAMINSLGEMMCFAPISGGYIHFAERFSECLIPRANEKWDMIS